jgi:hypothetical protein
MSATKRITWQPTQYGGWTGHLADLTAWMFQVWKTGTGYWQLDSTLPGQFGCHRYSNDPEELKGVAEMWLAEFAAPFAKFFPVAADDSTGTGG